MRGPTTSFAKRTIPRIAIVALVAVSLGPRISAATAESPLADYETMKKWRVSQPVPVPQGGVTITRDTATWTLTSGQLRYFEPAGGKSTGFLFEGEGHFLMTIPDPVEREALSRFTQKAGDRIDQKVRKLVVRTSDPSLLAQLPPPPSSGFAENNLAESRHERWLIDHRLDVDARIVGAIRDPGEIAIYVAIETADFDWLHWSWDSARNEEIQLSSWNSRFVERWISLDRPEDRNPDGRPGARESMKVWLEHIDVKADLTNRKLTSGRVGATHQQLMNGRYLVIATFVGLAESTSTLRVDLNSRAEKLVARDDDGRTIPILRDNIGKRSVNLANRVHDPYTTLLLDRPIRRDERRKITFEYELELANFAPGGGWYPEVPESFHHGHTARLELTIPKKIELRAMGKRVSETAGDDDKTAVWVVEKPAKMITFATSDHPGEEEVHVDGVPVIKAFGSTWTTFSSGAMMRNVAGDVANSVKYFQTLLDHPLGFDSMYVTNIASAHGQAFDGFLHMSEYTFKVEQAGASEKFRAHEVAHEWWGHRIGWASYRDSWLSESFAEYLAMMYVETQVKGGDRFLEEILDSYEGVIRGDLSGGFSRFVRPGLIQLNNSKRNRIGPIAHGPRASTFDMPNGYLIQNYVKGPLVLHMVRQILRFRTGSDATFVKILRDFVDQYSGKAAATDDFRRVVEANTPGDWRPFFRSWVGLADIPTFRWSYAQEPGSITLTLRRSDAPASFATFIPVKLEYEDGTAEYVIFENDRSEQTFSHKIARKVKNVVVGPEHSLIGFIKRG